MGKSLEKRTEKVINWLKNPLNLALVGIVLFTIIIRLYYFLSTNGQPLWWDEAEYMNMAQRWAFGIEYPFHAVRPILLSLVSSVFLRLSDTEFLPRLLILGFSLASVLGVYLLAKELFNKKIGLLSSLLMSAFYLNLFFSFRILVDLPSLTFFTFSAWLFYAYFKYSSKKYLYWASAVVAIGTLMRLTTSLVLLAVLIYLLVTENIKIVKKKELWVAGIIFVILLLPYIIWGFSEFGGFVITEAGKLNAAESWTVGFNVLFNYVKLFPTYLTWPLLIFFLVGLVFMLRVVIGFDILIKNRNKKLKRDLFLLLLFLVPLIAISFLIGHNENRYILNSFPAICILASYAIFFTYYKIRKHSKFIAIVLFLALVGFIVFSQVQEANSLIVSKQNSYIQVAEAGKWLKANSQPDEGVFSSSVTQIQYYSERETSGFPQEKEMFEKIRAEGNFKYYMISLLERSPEWAYAYPEENKLSTVQAYFADAEKTQPLLIIYKF